MATPIHNLYMASSVTELTTIANEVQLAGKSVQDLWQLLDDTFWEAVAKDNENNEEAAYMLYRRHIHVFEQTRTSAEYLQDKDYWDQPFSKIESDCQTSIARSTYLADSLNSRNGSLTDKLRTSLKQRSGSFKVNDTPETDEGSFLSDNDSEFEDDTDGAPVNKAILVKNLPPVISEDAVELYFVQQKRSNGGPVEKVELLGDGSAIVHFEDAAVAARVLKKTDHSIKGKSVQVEAHVPVEPTIDTDCTIEVRGFKSLSEDVVEFYFDDTRKSGGSDVTRVARSEDGSVILVTFENSKVAKRVLNRPHQIKQTVLQVCPYKEVETVEEEQFDSNCTVEVRNFGKLSETALELYFENKKKSSGGDISDLTRQDDVIFITFESEKAATRVVNQQHVIKGQELSVVSLNATASGDSETVKQSTEHKTIRVKGSAGLSGDELEMYFENRRRSGGGHVAHTETRGKDVYITFENVEDAERVANQNHSAFGRILDVLLYKEDDKTAEEADTTVESFGELDADSYSSDEDDEEKEETSVLKIGDISRISEDTMTLYFENRRRSGGGDVELFERSEDDDSALVYFKDGDAVERILQKAPHMIDSKPLSLCAYTRTRSQGISSWLRSLRKANTIEVKGCKDIKDDMIHLYFDNEKRSGGSGMKLLKRSDEDKNIVYVVFRNTSVASTVSSKTHKIGSQTIETKLITPRPKYDNRFLVTEMQDTTEEKQLSDFLMKRTPCHPLVFVWGEDNCAVLVTVDTAKLAMCIRDIQQACNRRPLLGAFLDISPVPISNCILVLDFDDDTDEDHLLLYFESSRSGNKLQVNVEHVEIRCPSEALVYFKDYKVIELILQKKPHKLGSADVRVTLFMDCLQAATAPFQIPPTIYLSHLNEFRVRFIRESPDKEAELVEQLDKVHAHLTWVSNDSAEIECILNKDVPHARVLVKSWERQSRETFDSFLKCYEVKEEKVLDIIWEVVKPRLEGLRKRDCGIYFLRDSRVVVVGPRDDVVYLIDDVQAVIKTAEGESSKDDDDEISESMRNIDPIVLRLMTDSGFSKELTTGSTSLKVRFGRDFKEITFTGTMDDVRRAREHTQDKADTVIFSDSAMVSQGHLELACLEGVRKYMLSKMKIKDINASWTRDGNKLRVAAFSDQDCHAALQSIKQMIIEQKIPLKQESVSLTETPQWQDLVDDRNTSEYVRIMIITDREKPMVRIFATDEGIINITEEINNFIDENTIYTDFVQYCSGVQRFLVEHEKDYIKTLEAQYKKYSVEVTEGIAKARFNIRGTKAGLNSVRSMLDKLAEKVEHIEHMFDKPGIANLLRSDKGENVIRRVEEFERCIIENVVEVNEAPAYGRTVVDEDNVGPPEVKVTTTITSGKKLYVCQGDITSLEVDAIVNAANQKLQHVGGLAKAIADKGGDVIRKESGDIIKQKTDIMVGDAVVTRGGKLKCKWVIHAVGPVWAGGQQGEEEQLREAVFRSLEVADEKDVKSLAISAISTGIFNYPRDEATRCIVKAIKEYLEDSDSDSGIEEIYACDQSVQTVGAFLRAVEEEGSSAAAAAAAPVRKPVGGVKMPGAQEMTDGFRTFTIGKMKVLLKEGDLTKEDAHCIVNCTNNDFNMDRGSVSRAIAKAGGNDLEKELMGKGKEMAKNGIVVTRGGGHIEAPFIVHVSVEYNNFDWKDTIKKCLKAPFAKAVTTIAFPAIGTGGYDTSPETMGVHLAEAVSEIKSQIKEIRLVMLQEEYISLFAKGIRTVCNKLKDKKSGFSALAGAIKKKMPWKKSDPTVKLHFFSDRKNNIEQAIARIEQHYMDNRSVKEIVNKSLERLDEQQKEEIEKLKETFSVQVDYQARLGKVRVQGVSSDVLAAMEAVYKIIQDVEQYKQMADKAKMLATYLQWTFVEEDSTVAEFDKISNQIIEDAFNSGRKAVQLELPGQGKIEIDFENSVWYLLTNPEKKLTVIRKNRIRGASSDLPSSWDPMNSASELVPVAPDSEEYRKLEKRFFDSVGGRRHIVKIQRVQTKFLWQQYGAKKEQLAVQNPGHDNERLLWHGTTAEAYESIAKSGFNRSYCGKNATAYGDGVYFAQEASYSAQSSYSKVDKQGHKHIFLARVLTGVFTKGKNGLRVPPTRDEAKHLLYDSVVDDPNKPAMFIIFNDTQAYPDYLISFG